MVLIVVPGTVFCRGQPIMKLALVTDAWHPQVNGVVTTLNRTRDCLEKAGDEVLVLSPQAHRTLPCPSYPEIRLAIAPGSAIAKTLRAFDPDAIHVATEGPLGLAAAAYCARHRLAFTTSYHTQFPEYIRKRAPIPLAWTYAWLRRHHSRARRTMVATEQQRARLAERGFHNLVLWSRGVDTSLFRPYPRGRRDFSPPIWMYAGRVAVEKNLEAFLDLDLDGSKVVVGDGPDRAALHRRYPSVHFLGYRFGEELARLLASADVFVFPSRTDTFGLVMLEAMACGTPVAAYPVTGPIDVVSHGTTGILDEDLRSAALAALAIPRTNCHSHALRRTWDNATRTFRSYLVDCRSGHEAV
jgi:glycosyltransferase involved in cell wall biosynthesis